MSRGRKNKDHVIYKRLPMISQLYMYSVGDDGGIIKTSRKQYIETTASTYTKDGKRTVKIANKEYCVKHLVAMAFIPKYKKGMSVCHKDGNANNCAVENLVVMDKRELGRLTGGESNRRAVIYNGIEYYSIRECSKALHCSYQTLNDYLGGRVKKSVLDGINVKYAD